MNQAKYLDVIFDKRTTWRLHIETIETKAFRTFIRVYSLLKGARGSVVGWGTMLQTGSWPVRVPDEVDFSIYLILPAALWP
jgi:hypothetical protein